MTGIKGSGMTALAQLLSHEGVKVCGSDVSERFLTDEVLEKLGIPLEGFSADTISHDVDAVVYSTAYKESHPELVRAKELGIPCISYPEALASLFNDAYGVAIAGSHGKTTTTALVGSLLKKLDKDPTVIVGSKSLDFGTNATVGNSPYFVLEADEYQNKLAHYLPKLAILLNVDYDHPDFFPTRKDYFKVFEDFSQKVAEEGMLIACADDAGVAEILPTLPADKVITFGWGAACRFRAEGYVIEGGMTKFSAYDHDRKLGDFSLPLFGRHNVSNALGAIAALSTLGVDFDERFARILADFKGTARRFEKKGTIGKTLVIDDYAHHPREVQATLRAAREVFPGKTIWCVFGPHTFSRTVALRADFAKAFDEVDTVILLDIYASAREEATELSSRDLVNDMVEAGSKAVYGGSVESTVAYLRDRLEAIDVVITMGAGDSWRVGELLLETKELR